MDVLSAAVLGVIQGLTEFLPVSSSGHLILARAFFNWDPGRFGVPFDVACHVGTLLAVVAYFNRDLTALIMTAPGALIGKTGDWYQLGRLIVVGTIPIVIIGGLFADSIENSLRSPQVVAVTLVIGAIGLIIAERLCSRDRGIDDIGYTAAICVGLAQAAALAPGISRSGATISMAMLFGLERRIAARFVFLLSLPAIVAAAAKEVLELRKTGFEGLPLDIFAIGFVVSAVVGYLTMRFFMRFLSTHSLHVFAYYRFGLAAVTILWLLTR